MTQAGLVRAAPFVLLIIRPSSKFQTMTVSFPVFGATTDHELRCKPGCIWEHRCRSSPELFLICSRRTIPFNLRALLSLLTKRSPLDLLIITLKLHLRSFYNGQIQHPASIKRYSHRISVQFNAPKPVWKSRRWVDHGIPANHRRSRKYHLIKPIFVVLVAQQPLPQINVTRNIVGTVVGAGLYRSLWLLLEVLETTAITQSPFQWNCSASR